MAVINAKAVSVMERPTDISPDSRQSSTGELQFGDSGLFARCDGKGLLIQNGLFESPMFGFLSVLAPIQPEIPAPNSETCCISDSNIPNFNATLRDSFWTPLEDTGQAFMFRAEYSLAISCWQKLVEDGFQMFAVIEDGNRQHRVQEGSFLSVDYRGTEVQAGSSITFDRVLLANGGGASIVGAPTISGASVVAEVVIATEKGPKLEIQRLRKRKNSRRHTGHRQKYTRVKVTSITVPGLAVVEK